jgi:hypothetical protein
MRQLLEQHGEVARLYMAPEMASLRAKRKKLKGNTGKNFTEGWVEFEDKRVAKSVRVTSFYVIAVLQISRRCRASACHCIQFCDILFHSNAQLTS